MATVINDPTTVEASALASPSTAKVAVVKTHPTTVIEDYARVMEDAKWHACLDLNSTTIVKLNLSWTKYFPACSSQPCQLEGTLRALLKG